jgi:co-chaperonin GroES (HSP10)
MRLLNGNVLVRNNKEDKVTPSGIIMSTELMEKWNEYQWGTVVALGDCRKTIYGDPVRFTVEIGDTVYYKRDNFRVKVEHEGEEVEVMKEESILFGVRKEK